MKLNGLVLTGGKSSRLGFDKGRIRWHGVPQWQFTAELLSGYCTEVFISGDRIEQQSFQAIPDRVAGIGPLAGIYSALLHDPSASWFVLACDLPLIREAITAMLEAHKQQNSITCGFNPARKQVEPLVSIWEPDNLPQLKKKIEENNYSLQDIAAKARLVELDPHILTNVNTPEEYFQLRSELPYVPIDCNYYDIIETAALRGTRTLEYYNGSHIIESQDKISTTEIKDHSEYIILASGAQVRMDMISSINGISRPKQ